MSSPTNSKNERTTLIRTLHGQIDFISKRKAAEEQSVKSTGPAGSPDMMDLRHAAMAFVRRVCGSDGNQSLDMIPFLDFYFAAMELEREVDALRVENKRLSDAARHLAKARM